MRFQTNINCGGCIETVKPYLNALESVDAWDVDIRNPNKILTVNGDVDPESVKKAVKAAGFEIKEKKQGFLQRMFG